MAPNADTLSRMTRAKTMRSKTRGRGRPPATGEPLRPITIRLAPTVIDMLLREVARRKLDGSPNRTIQDVVSEAVIEKLRKT